MDITIEEFEKLKDIYKDSKETIIKDDNNIKAREVKLIFLDNYYDYDKNELSPNYPPSLCRWNGKDIIWEWAGNLDKNTSFFICANEIRISTYKYYVTHKTNVNYTIELEDKNIFINNKSSVNNCAEDVEEVIVKFLKNIDKMDIKEEIKSIVKNIVNNSEYVYSKDYKGFRKGGFNVYNFNNR